MPVRNEEANDQSGSTATDFDSRLRGYSRAVSDHLELEALTAGKVAGISAAACTALSAHQSAEAAIRYSGPVNVGAAVYTNFSFGNAPFSIDGLANFGVSAAKFSYSYLYGLVQVGFGTTGTVNNTGAPGPKGEEIAFAPGASGDNQPDRLGAGTTIDSNSPWFAPALNAGNANKALIQANNYYPYSAASGNNWPNPAAGFNYPAYGYGYFYSNTGFAGVRFNTAGGNAKHNGWVRLRLINNGITGGFTPRYQVGNVSVLDWAYETTPDAPIQVPTPLEGDYNGDGVIDAADYTVYRDAEGQNFPLLNRDPNAQGAPVVDGDDYAFWVSNFGASGGSPASAVPEPGTATILGLGLLATGASGVRRHRRTQERATKQED